MPLLDLYRVVRDASKDNRNSLKGNHESLPNRLLDVFLRTWDLGFTAFGGPPVHFKIIHHRFVQGSSGHVPWLDEQTYQELFAVCQALPGPGSTKMLFCTALLHAGLIPALFVLLLWSLPVAIAMVGLAIGISHLQQQLPDSVYALLSGLNASTVGIIALAAVQLSEGAIKDNLSRILVIFGACAGLCYSALWYFPVLIIFGGLITLLWDIWMCKRVLKILDAMQKKKANNQVSAEESSISPLVRVGPSSASASASISQQSRNQSDAALDVDADAIGVVEDTEDDNAKSKKAKAKLMATRNTQTTITDLNNHKISVKSGLIIIFGFFITFTIIIAIRGALRNQGRLFSLFANMYLAGTIIFGGGPVVIPLLRQYVVEPGWVEPRDFLIGLALIQAAPGPNFNFAVYLGTLAVGGTEYPVVLGAIMGWSIFLPGITLAVGFQGIWSAIRSHPIVIATLRGINSVAVGLVFTAVYRLWQIGYLSRDFTAGQSLGLNPWWLVVSTVSYAATAWFKVPPAIAIVFGAILGLCWYGAVGRHQ